VFTLIKKLSKLLLLSKEFYVHKLMNNQFIKQIKAWVKNTENFYPPQYFMTILWNDLPSDSITASSHTRHLLNVLKCKFYSVKRCSNIPCFPKRFGAIVFQERKPFIQTRFDKYKKKYSTYKIAYHTHIHIINWNLKETRINFIRDQIIDKLGDHVYKLLKTDTEDNRGLTLKKWSDDYHSNYNYKDFNYKYSSDGDLVLDYENSDLIPLR